MNNGTGFCTFVNQIETDDTLIDDAYGTIFDSYERVVIKALVTSFGLDFLIQDRHGGDVDTIHNVNQIGKDPAMRYKNSDNEEKYANRGEYSAKDYHAGGNFQETKHEAREKYYNDGFQPIKDEYTRKQNLGFYGKSKNVPADMKAELDHIVETKHIHDDHGRVLAGLDGATLADSPENFAWTNKSLNASMGSWANQQMIKWEKDCEAAKKNGTALPPKPDVDMVAYLNAHPEIDGETKARMLKCYKKAKGAYDAKVNRAYYTSKSFWKDTGKAATKLGISMGLRQALGLVFTEIWFTVKDSIIECKKTGGSLFKKIAEAVKKGIKNAKQKFKEIWDKFIEGSVSGILSSLITTLTNIFLTTAKNVVKIIRESFASLTEATKILFINPDCYSLGDRFVAASKVLATGASVVAGSMVRELLSKTPVVGIPIVGDTIPTFCSVLVTGIISCSFLYLLDHSKIIKKAIAYLNNLPDIDNFNASLKKQSELLDKYLSALSKIDFDKLQEQEAIYSKAALRLSNCKTDKETNECLIFVHKRIGLDLPWKGYDSFDSFMTDKKARLVFS